MCRLETLRRAVVPAVEEAGVEGVLLILRVVSKQEGARHREERVGGWRSGPAGLEVGGRKPLGTRN